MQSLAVTVALMPKTWRTVGVRTTYTKDVLPSACDCGRHLQPELDGAGFRNGHAVNPYFVALAVKRQSHTYWAFDPLRPAGDSTHETVSGAIWNGYSDD